MNTAKVYQMKTPMQKQQDPLNLQSLPLVAPESDLWPRIETELRRAGRRRAMAGRIGAALAVAAAVMLAIGVVLRLPSSGPAAQPASTADATTPGLAERGSRADAPVSLDDLIALSQGLERRLRLIRAQVGDLPARAVVYQVELEDLVVQVDEELSRSPESVPLWTQRVDLLMDLERLYQSGLRREYRQMASL